MLKDNEKYNALDFIKDNEINSLIAKGKELVSDKELVREIIEKSKSAEGLTPEETAVLINLEDNPNSSFKNSLIFLLSYSLVILLSKILISSLRNF